MVCECKKKQIDRLDQKYEICKTLTTLVNFSYSFLLNCMHRSIVDASVCYLINNTRLWTNWFV